MKRVFQAAMLLGWGAVCLPAASQSSPATFPLAGDWQGVLEMQGTVYHLVLHMNTTPEGKMTALLDNTDQNMTGDPAIGGSFDGSRLMLRFFYWKPNSNGDLEEKVSSYEATVSASGAEMTGVLTQEGSWPLNFKRLTWEAKNPKPAPPTIFDGEWAGIEEEGRGLELHFVLHIANTEDGLMALLDCPEEKFKGALASKVSYDQDSRQISITFFRSVFAGKMTADGKALDTSMTEPGYHFLIHFDRLPAKKAAPN
jgi:hypothetical protein